MRSAIVERLRTLSKASTRSGLDELVVLERAVCVAMPLSRRVSVFSLTGGVGCSTVATEVAALLARLRQERIRLVSAQGSSPVPRPPAGSALEILALPPESWPVAVPAWQAMLEAQPTRAQMTITDWGAAPMDALRPLGAGAHAICLVTDASRPGIERAAAVARSLRDESPVAVCAVDVHRVATSATPGLLRQMPAPAYLLRFDARRPSSLELPRPAGSATSRELLRLGAELMSAVVTPDAERAGAEAQP